MKTVTTRYSQIAQIRSFSRPAKLFLVATILDGIVYSAWSLFFNFYILERGFSREFLGLVTASGSIAALLLGIPLGLLSDRLGRKRAMLLGVAVYVIANGLEVTVTSPTMILAMAFLAGAASTLYLLSHAPFMMKVSTSENRALLFSMNFGLITLAGSVGNVFAGQLPTLFGEILHVSARSATAYQAVLLSAVVLGSLTLVPLALIKEPRSSEVSEAPTRALASLKRTLARPMTLKLAMPNLLVGFGAAILIPYANVFFNERFAISDQTLGLIFSLSALLTGIGSIFGPRLAHRMNGKIKAVVFTQGLSLIFLILLGATHSLWLAGVGFLMRAMLMNMASPLFDAFAMEQVHESEQATVNSIKSLAWQVGWSVGPYISGLVQAKYGFNPLFVTTGILYALATALTWYFFRKNEQPLVSQLALASTD